MNGRRVAGISLAVYGIATMAAFGDSPGGAYDDSSVVHYISAHHTWAAFGLAYLGVLGALALLPFGLGLRDEAGRARDLVWGLTVAGSAAGLVGWFVTGGLAVAMAEGGSPVRDHLAHPAVYTVSEIGKLVAVCAPALCVGVIAIVLARTASLPGWLRAFSFVAGVCGIFSAAYFTLMVFGLWTLVAGVALAATGRSAGSVTGNGGTRRVATA